MENKMLLIIIPAAFVLLCAVAIGIMRIAIGHGGVMSILSTIRLRTHMMRAEQYKDPNGFALPYRIYVPENIAEGEQLPVVLFLSGDGRRGTDNRKQTRAFGVAHVLLSRSNRAKYPCIVVAPQMPLEGNWFDDETMPVLMGMLEQVAANYPADPARIYVTGLSLGGSGTWEMLLTYPDYFAAGVPICGGGWNPEEEPSLASSIKDIPIWAFCGEKDVSWNYRAMVAALENAGSTRVKYTEYPGEGHWSWGRTYYEPELYEWMFAQAKQ